MKNKIIVSLTGILYHKNRCFEIISRRSIGTYAHSNQTDVPLLSLCAIRKTNGNPSLE